MNIDSKFISTFTCKDCGFEFNYPAYKRRPLPGWILFCMGDYDSPRCPECMSTDIEDNELKELVISETGC